LADGPDEVHHMVVGRAEVARYTAQPLAGLQTGMVDYENPLQIKRIPMPE